jgi:hypothetical protein
MTTRREGTMLIRPLDLKQLSQGVSQKLVSPCFGWLEGSYEIIKAHEMRFKQSQNEVKLSLKPTPKSKGDRTRV